MPPRADNRYAIDRQIYFAHEVARMLGMSTDNLYRKGVLERLYSQGFPESVLLGRLRFPRQLVDAWFARRPGPAAPANDATAAPPIAHQPDQAQREFLHRAYAQARHTPR
jgi:predicted DNA-binding transcriptional regulator AlpA